MDLTEKTVNSQTIFEGRIIKVTLDQARLPDGKLASREVVYHPGGVAVLALDDLSAVGVQCWTGEGEAVLAELFFSRLEYRMLKNAPEVNLYIEHTDKSCIEELLRLFREADMKILNMGIIRSDSTEKHNACAIFTLRLRKGAHQEDLMDQTRSIPGVVSVRQL